LPKAEQPSRHQSHDHFSPFQVAFRSLGKFAIQSIVRTKSSAERWWSKGHGTLFDDTKGDWWLVFHGYEKDFYNMGRQTLLQPVEWTGDGWFKLPDGLQTDQPIKKPAGKSSEFIYTLSDDFGGQTLKPHWKFFGEYDPGRFHWRTTV
jgi:beta-xylosidase